MSASLSPAMRRVVRAPGAILRKLHGLVVAPLVARLDAAAWVCRETLRGNVGSVALARTLYTLRRLGQEGFYHPIPIDQRHTTTSVGGMRVNRPLTDPDYPRVFWDMVTAEIGHDFTGKSVVDIGPAEGYFTLDAARAGARVTAIHPPHPFIGVLRALTRWFGVQDRVRLIVGFYPEAGLEAISGANVILCLGLLYHLDDLVVGLAPMLRSPATLVIEGIFLKQPNPDFAPATHKNNEPVCPAWLEAYLRAAGREVKWIDAWQAYVERPGNLRHAHTRRALIAFPAGSKRS